MDCCQLSNLADFRNVFNTFKASLGQSPWSMAMCLVWQSVYYWVMVKTGPFFVSGRTVDSEGGGVGLAVFKINILVVKHLK